MFFFPPYTSTYKYIYLPPRSEMGNFWQKVGHGMGKDGQNLGKDGQILGKDGQFFLHCQCKHLKCIVCKFATNKCLFCRSTGSHLKICCENSKRAYWKCIFVLWQQVSLSERQNIAVSPVTAVHKTEQLLILKRAALILFSENVKSYSPYSKSSLYNLDFL